MMEVENKLKRLNRLNDNFMVQIFKFSLQNCGYISGGRNYLLLAMDITKVGGPLSVVKVGTSMLCTKIGYR
jgi:hypothetical protein